MSEVSPRKPFSATRRILELVPQSLQFLMSKRDQVARLKAELSRKDAIILEQSLALAQSQKIFEKASAAAKIGVWQCSLPDETLEWTDVVYDLFDLPRGSPLDRKKAVACYSEEAAKELEKRRSSAIANRSGFGLDAEIVTAKGNRRWIRITASIECENDVPVRIFGMKQDITQQKILFDQTRYLAEFDAMTGLANRSQFQANLAALCDTGDRSGALLLIDLDGFKKVNDTLGHAAGDECLQEMAVRLSQVCQNAKVVARIGGDEFGVLTGPEYDRNAIEAFAQRIVDALARPVEQGGRCFRSGASVGIAFVVDGDAPAELFKRADSALYAAKAAGRSAYRIF